MRPQIVIAQGYFDRCRYIENEPHPSSSFLILRTAYSERKSPKRCDTVIIWTSGMVAIPCFYTYLHLFFHAQQELLSLFVVRALHSVLCPSIICQGAFKDLSWPFPRPPPFLKFLPASPLSALHLYFLSAWWLDYLSPREHAWDGNDIHPGKIRECTHRSTLGAGTV